MNTQYKISKSNSGIPCIFERTWELRDYVSFSTIVADRNGKKIKPLYVFENTEPIKKIGNVDIPECIKIQQTCLMPVNVGNIIVISKRKKDSNNEYQIETEIFRIMNISEKNVATLTLIKSFKNGKTEQHSNFFIPKDLLTSSMRATYKKPSKSIYSIIEEAA